jgi:alpha-N-acetylglucosamine transferase
MEGLVYIIILIIVIWYCNQEITLVNGGSSDNKTAWVTLVMKGDNYIAGAIALAQSLRSNNTKHKIVCMVTSDVTGADDLRKIFDDVVVIEYIDVESKRLFTEKQDKIYENWKCISYTKWRCMELGYDKVIFVDADIVMLANNDLLFDIPAPAGTFSTTWTKNTYKKLNIHKFGADVESIDIKHALTNRGVVATGSVVILPSCKGFESWLQKSAPYGNSNCISMVDEQSIAEFMISKKYKWKHIPIAFNCIPWKWEWLAPEVPRLYHYFNKIKPWMDDFKFNDVNCFWTYMNLATKKNPEFKKYLKITPSSIDYKVCSYCEGLKKDYKHSTINEQGILTCPVILKAIN